MKVSIFHDMTCKLPLPGLLEGVANLIRTDEKLAVFTQSYRQTGSKTFKNESQLFAVPCLFEGGKGRSNIRQLTGMSLVDFDHVFPIDGTADKADSNALQELKAKIIADPHTLMSYITMSGNGLRVIFTYEIAPEFSGVPKDEDEVKKFEAYYQQAFYAGNAYYEKLLGAKADMQCKNITRLSGLAHDPEVFLRPQSEVIPFTAEEISTAATAYVKQGEIGYMFVDDEKILEVNNEYLGHDYYTDVITFDYDEPGIVSGDIVISLDTVRTNAEKFGKQYDDELHRVIIHGILHLCGINDKGPGEREIMEDAENKALAMLQNLC